MVSRRGKGVRRRWGAKRVKSPRSGHRAVVARRTERKEAASAEKNGNDLTELRVHTMRAVKGKGTERLSQNRSHSKKTKSQSTVLGGGPASIHCYDSGGTTEHYILEI